MVGESARWGDSKREPPLTRNSHWLTEINRIANSYIPQRTGILLNQLKAKGLYPSLAAPTLNQFGGNVVAGFQLTLSAPVGTVYYTRDGTDPRLTGGGVSPTAQVYSGPITLNQSTRLQARAFDGTTWSALDDTTFYVIQNFDGLLITEIMYHPPDTTPPRGTPTNSSNSKTSPAPTSN